MSFEKPYVTPTPASEVIAERKLRALSESNANVVASVSEQLADSPAPDSSAEGMVGEVPYELRPGLLIHEPHIKARPPVPPGIPTLDVSPEASYPNRPPQTL